MGKVKNNRNQYYMFNNKQPTHHILWQPHLSIRMAKLIKNADITKLLRVKNVSNKCSKLLGFRKIGGKMVILWVKNVKVDQL